MVQCNSRLCLCLFLWCSHTSATCKVPRCAPWWSETFMSSCSEVSVKLTWPQNKLNKNKYVASSSASMGRPAPPPLRAAYRYLWRHLQKAFILYVCWPLTFWPLPVPLRTWPIPGLPCSPLGEAGPSVSCTPPRYVQSCARIQKMSPVAWSRGLSIQAFLGVVVVGGGV